jgi:very-short-patch-repair endonuclease
MNENWLANNLYWIVPTITIIIIAICGFIYKRIREKRQQYLENLGYKVIRVKVEKWSDE